MSKLLTLCTSNLRPGSPSIRPCGAEADIVWQGSPCQYVPSGALVFNLRVFAFVMQEDIVKRFGKKTGRLEEGPPAIAVT